MKRLLALLALLGIALLGAWLWRVLSVDPGYVQITLRGWSVETTAVVAVVAGLLAWLAIWLMLATLYFPWRWWRRHRRHVARESLSDGLVALHEGHWRRAEKLLRRAARDSEQRVPALLHAARAAQARGDAEHAEQWLAEAALQGDPIDATLQAARQHHRQGEMSAVTALFDPHPVATLPPRALELYLDALVQTGRAHDAYAMLPALRSSHVLEGDRLHLQEVRIIATALGQSAGAQALDRLWGGLSRAQRIEPEIVAAYARRAMQCGEAEAAIAAVEKALRKAWSPELVRVYGQLPRSERHSPLKLAEEWLTEHPDDPALLVTLGRLCRAEQLFGKAEDYLRRALAQGAGAEAWEELGHVHADDRQDARAREAYAKALACLRGEAPSQVTQNLREKIAHEAEAETRSSMGMPLLEDEGRPES